MYKEYRMYLRGSVRHLEFSSESGGQFPEAQRPVLKLKVDMFINFFHLPEAVTLKPRCKRPVFIKHCFLHCRVEPPSVSGVPRGVGFGVFNTPPPEIPKALQNCAKLNPICENC